MVLKLRMVVLKMEIGPNYDDVPTRSQLLTDRQYSCRRSQLSAEVLHAVAVKKVKNRGYLDTMKLPKIGPVTGGKSIRSSSEFMRVI